LPTYSKHIKSAEIRGSSASLRDGKSTPSKEKATSLWSTDLVLGCRHTICSLRYLANYDVSIRNEYDEIGVNFAGHTYYERGYDFDFNLQFYEYFFFNNIDEFQAQLEILIMTMKPESTFDDLKEILLNGWENTPDSSALQTMEQMYNRSKQNLFQ
jgi:hypothetical protein